MKKDKKNLEHEGIAEDPTQTGSNKKQSDSSKRGLNAEEAYQMLSKRRFTNGSVRPWLYDKDPLWFQGTRISIPTLSRDRQASKRDPKT